MDVYLDAVFHPNITKYQEIFMQEGWHYELESKDAPLIINGVVYNEMKGAYSSPDEVLETAIEAALFPDNTYSKNSGGNPDHIPELTYEAYLEFYHKYYHPCNSYIYLYGDMDVEERLDWMDRNYLSQFGPAEIDSSIEKQKPFDEIRYVETEYPITDDDPEENNTYLSYNKVVADVLDRELYQAFSVLDYVLVSAPGAPVRQALIDAGIGQDVYGSFEDGMLQPFFSIVAKNANKEDQERFVTIIEETLQKLVKEGLNQDALLAGINSAEFRFREADYGQFPKGLLYGLQCMESWLFDDTKPFIHLECLDTLQFLREQMNIGYFDENYESLQGIDVSDHQGEIDWQAVADAGYEFVFVRVGFRGYGAEGTLNEDSMAVEYMQGAEAAGLEVGAYFFSQAVNEEEAAEEALFAADVIQRSGVRMTLPLVYDPESIEGAQGRADNLSREQISANAQAFKKAAESAMKCKTALYTNLYWEKNYFDNETLNDFEIWYADYEETPQTPYHFTWWQYSETGSVPGIKGEMDLNLWIKRVD